MDSNKKRSLINTWKNLQINGYFEKHRLYDMKTVQKPPMIDKESIKNKIIVEIGCGYGRHTAWFSKYAKKIYSIEVSKCILNKTKKFVKKNGKINKVEFILVENYKEIIPNKVDIVFCYLVFQHLHEDETRDYINTFYEKLKNKTGIFIGQFLLGKNKIYYECKVPKVSYKIEEVRNMFNKYYIKNELVLPINEKKNTYHYYIVGEKI